MKKLRNLTQVGAMAICLIAVHGDVGAQGWKPGGGDPKVPTEARSDSGKSLTVPLDGGMRLTVDASGRATVSDGSIRSDIDLSQAAELLKKHGKSINEIVPAEIMAKRLPGLTGIESTPKGTTQRYTDGSKIELRPDVEIRTLKDGTQIEKLPEGTTIVRWPGGKTFIRNADGTAADVTPDGSITPGQGKIEVFPTGAVRRIFPDDRAVVDLFPDGTTRSRPDLAAGLPKTIGQVEKPATYDLPTKPRTGQIMLDTKLITRSQPAETLLGDRPAPAARSDSGMAAPPVKDTPVLGKLLTPEPSKPVTLEPLHRSSPVIQLAPKKPAPELIKGTTIR